MTEKIEIRTESANTAEDTAPTAKFYTLRPLMANDIMPMVNIVKKIGLVQILEIIRPAAPDFANTDGQSEEERVTALGLSVMTDIAHVIVDHLPACEQDIFKLLGDVSGLGDEGVRVLTLDVFGELLVDFLRKEELPAFFKAVSRFMK